MKVSFSIIVFLLVFNLPGFCQEKTFTFKGQIHYAGETLKGALLEIYTSGDLVYQTNSRGGGKFEFELEPEREYMVEISNDNLQTKTIWINTKGTAMLKHNVPAFGFDVYLKREKVTVYDELIEIPVTLIKYQANKKVFYMDKTYEDAIKNKKRRIKESTRPTR